MSSARPSGMATASPCRPARQAHPGRRVPRLDRSRQGVGRLGPGPVAVMQADQCEGQRREHGGDTAGGVHGIRSEVGGDLAEQFGQAGGVHPDVQARLGHDHGAGAERGRVPHVAEQLESLAGQSRRLGVAPGRLRERRRAHQEVELPDRAAEPFQAGAEIGEVTLDALQLAGLEQGVDPPQAAPHLDPGAAEVSAAPSIRLASTARSASPSGRSRPAGGPGARPRAWPGRPSRRRPARPG